MAKTTKSLVGRFSTHRTMAKHLIKMGQGVSKETPNAIKVRKNLALKAKASRNQSKSSN